MWPETVLEAGFDMAGEDQPVGRPGARPASAADGRVRRAPSYERDGRLGGMDRLDQKGSDWLKNNL